VLKGPSKALRRRLAELEAKRNQQFVPVDYDAIADAAKELLAWFDANRKACANGTACKLPVPPLTEAELNDPHFQAAMRNADRMHERLMRQEQEAKAAKRAAKMARKAASTTDS
jgi:hypothetical protein